MAGKENVADSSSSFMDTVMEYLQTLQRPCPVVLSRLKSIDDNAPPRVIYPDWFDPTRPLSKEMWGEKVCFFRNEGVLTTND